MALQTITLGYCLLGGSFSLHSYAKNISLTVETEQEDVTVFGDSYKDGILGLKSWKLDVSGFVDYADNLVDETMYGYWDAAVAIAMEIRPSSASVGVANPKYTGNILPAGWTCLGADVGKVSPFSISWPGTGALTRATA